MATIVATLDLRLLSWQGKRPPCATPHPQPHWPNTKNETLEQESSHTSMASHCASKRKLPSWRTTVVPVARRVSNILIECRSIALQVGFSQYCTCSLLYRYRYRTWYLPYCTLHCSSCCTPHLIRHGSRVSTPGKKKTNREQHRFVVYIIVSDSEFSIYFRKASKCNRRSNHGGGR